MRKTKISANAKVNFTLDVTGQNNGYHEIKSIVSAIDLKDDIILSKRKDDAIILKVTGDAGCDEKDNNAYKAGKLFKEKFNVGGFNVTVKKRIPLGGGLGGSSADISGTLLGLKKLFNLNCDLVPLANELGSDSAYMLKGGFAVISGRGEKVQSLNVQKTLYLILLFATEFATSKTVYNKLDELSVQQNYTTDDAVSALVDGDDEKFFLSLSNGLYIATKSIVKEVEQNLEELKRYAPAVMTGSGSTVFAVFTDKKKRDEVYKALKKKFGKRLIKSQTV